MDAKLREFRQRKKANTFKLSEENEGATQNQNSVVSDKGRAEVNSDSARLRKKKLLEMRKAESADQPELLDNIPLMPDLEYEEKIERDWQLLYAERALKFVIWCLLMALFVVFEFGAVFFVMSVFYFMYINFRKTPKRPGELSAYSVFNPNFETLKGTVTAEQFERELVYGAASTVAH